MYSKLQRGRVLGALGTALLALTLAACGGGGGSSAPPTDPTPAPTATITPTPSQVAPGQPVTLAWSSTNATSVSISPSVSATALPLSGSVTVTPTSTTPYTITASGAGGTVTASATVTVAPVGPPPTVTLVANPTAINSGGTATLTWTSTNADTVSIAPAVGTAPLPVNGSASVTPTSTTTYTITATGHGGTATATATVTFTTTPVPTVTLTASPATVFTGGTVTLTWTSSNADTVSIAPAVGTGPLTLNGSTTAVASATTTYTITAIGGGQTATATATVTVLPQGTAQSEIHHLIVVIMQNHSFDNLFGFYPGANGLSPTVPGYSQVDKNGTTVSPTLLPNLDNANLNHDHTTYTASYDGGKMDKFAYTNGDLSMQYADNTVFGTTKDGQRYGVTTLWDYAQQYALADNFFGSALNTEPSQMLYMMAATVHDDHTSGSLPYYDKCSAVEKARSGGSISVPLTETNIGDQMNTAKVSWTYAQGNYATSVDETCSNYIPQENPFQYFTSTQYSANLQDFSLANFQNNLTDSALPSVMFITPGPSYGMHPGSGDAANGIEWLDNFVQTVKSSQVWPDTAIVVLWDESGGWYDHVPPPQLPNSQGLGMRVPVIVISPFAKAGVISHQQMDFVSITRFIQWNWGLGMFTDPAQNAREQQSGDICDLLTIPCSSP
jgi:phospholipase C